MEIVYIIDINFNEFALSCGVLLFLAANMGKY